MRALRVLLIVAAAGVLLAIAGCGNDDAGTGDAEPAGTGEEGSLDGRAFWSTGVTEAGAERPLVDDTRIALDFQDGSIGASAGCNSMGGAYRIDDGVLVVSDLFSTEIGCDPERHEQDQFVADLLTASPTIAIDGDRLVLTSDTAAVEFLDREVADPDRPVVGTTWEVTGFLEGETASSFAVDEPATLVFDDQSNLTGFDGCTGFTMPVEVSDGSVGGPVEGDGEIQFGPIALDDVVDCSAELDQYRSMVQAVLTGQATYMIDGPNLTILSDDLGLTLRAR